MKITEYVQQITNEPGLKKNCGTWFHSPLRTDAHPSFEVNDDIGKWHDWGSGQYGGIYDLVMLVENCDFQTAKRIVGEQETITKKVVYEKKINYDGISTNKYFYHTSLVDYARKRCVSFDVLKEFCVEVVKDKYYYIGMKNDAGGYALRNEFFKGQFGSNDITTIHGNDTALVFEGMFDFLSFRSYVKCPLNCTYIVLNTTQNISRIDVSKYKTIHLYLDNDKAGDDATKKIVGAIDHRKNYIQYGDVNDYICNKIAL